MLIADDESLVRGGLRMILEAQSDMEMAGEAADGKQAVEAAAEARPDVVLMDVRMPVMDGLEASRRILKTGLVHRPKVIMLTTFDLDEYVYEAMRAGASGFLLKTSSPEELVGGIRSVVNGDALLSPAITRRLVEQFIQRPPPGRPPDAFSGLSERELDVLKLMAKGLSNREVAERLFVSEATVKTHVNHIFTKLQLRDRVQAVVLAYESGLVPPGAPS